MQMCHVRFLLPAWSGHSLCCFMLDVTASLIMQMCHISFACLVRSQYLLFHVGFLFPACIIDLLLDVFLLLVYCICDRFAAVFWRAAT